MHIVLRYIFQSQSNQSVTAKSEGPGVLAYPVAVRFGNLRTRFFRFRFQLSKESLRIEIFNHLQQCLPIHTFLFWLSSGSLNPSDFKRYCHVELIRFTLKGHAHSMIVLSISLVEILQRNIHPPPSQSQNIHDLVMNSLKKP